jgi:hypothetical protein
METQASETAVVVRALSPSDCRRQAACICDRKLGDQCWRFTNESIAPCLVSLGGRARLYEGRFQATRV